jgi:hypothetical protein
MMQKPQVLSQYKTIVQGKIETLQNMISDLSEDAQNDAKGSAGDKHETALAMMHLEQEKLNMKLKEVLEQKSVLESIDVSKAKKLIALGSLVQTNTFLFFISTALPKITIEGLDVVALSPSSPLGAIMLGKEVNQEFEFNGMKYKVLTIE